MPKGLQRLGCKGSSSRLSRTTMVTTMKYCSIKHHLKVKTVILKIPGFKLLDKRGRINFYTLPKQFPMKGRN